MLVLRCHVTQSLVGSFCDLAIEDRLGCQCLVSGNVGPPLTCNYIKLVDVPDLEYFSANDQGEVVSS